MNDLIGLGPWYVCRKLTACIADGKTHLAPSGEWVTKTAPVAPWSGTRAAAILLASRHGGDAVPSQWVDIRAIRRDWREKQSNQIASLR